MSTDNGEGCLNQQLKSSLPLLAEGSETTMAFFFKFNLFFVCKACISLTKGLIA